jgi:hypothetical protein
MRLSSAVVSLFEYPIADIRAALPDPSSSLWGRAPFRQHLYDPHGTTRSIVFEWLDNSWRPGEPLTVLSADYPPPALTTAATACALALAKRLDGTVAKLMLAELPAGGIIREHRDRAPALVTVHRCHLPIVTDEQVVFLIDGEPHFLEPGTVYEVDNTRRHAVENRSAARRVHLICDIMPAQPVP